MVVNGLLTAVRGLVAHSVVGRRVTNVLLSLQTDKEGKQTWSEHYPPMPTKCCGAAVVCSGNSLVVAGGLTGDDTAVVVEVMNTNSLQWFTASSLPHYFNSASATVCGDSLYLMGGLTVDASGEDGSLSVLTCSLTALQVLPLAVTIGQDEGSLNRALTHRVEESR